MKILVSYYIEHVESDLKTIGRSINRLQGEAEITQAYVKIWGTQEFPNTSVRPQYLPWHRINHVEELP